MIERLNCCLHTLHGAHNCIKKILLGWSFKTSLNHKLEQFDIWWVFSFGQHQLPCLRLCLQKPGHIARFNSKVVNDHAICISVWEIGRKYGNLFIEKKPWTTSRQMQRKNSQMLSIQVLATNREIYIPLTALSLHPFLFTVGLWSEWSKSVFWGLRTLKPLT